LIKNLKIKIYADVASEKDIDSYSSIPYIKGFTTNPSLLKKAGVKNYQDFACTASKLAKDKGISFEVVSDNEVDILKEAYAIASWGENVFVKVPFLKTDGSDNSKTIETLAKNGVSLNVTAILTLDQVKRIAECANPNVPMIVSVFAGRIADTGVDPEPMMREAKEILKHLPKAELLWASSREIFNVVQAENCGCDIITLTPDLLGKFKLWGTDLTEYSRQTAEMFYNDARSAGLVINHDSTIQNVA
jgi:transaldolase